MLINNDFLGNGWSFPVVPGVTGRFQWSSGAADIHESIGIILSTAHGERVMVPTFGCRLCELVFAADNATTLGLAEHYAKQALAAWEPRIDVQQVEAMADPDARNRMLVSVDYVVRETNRPGNFVYPFYLK